MKVNITVKKVAKPFKIVFMRSNTKISESAETDGNFTFPSDIVEGELVSCESWKVNNKLLSGEKLTFADDEGNEVSMFAYDVETIKAIATDLKSSGNSGLIVKAR